MERKELEQIFCWKACAELRAFQYSILQKEKEEIYGAAYQIDSMISLYELLLEMSGTMEEETLSAAIACPGLLDFLYNRWLKYEDSHMEELQACIKQELAVIGNKNRTKGWNKGYEEISIDTESGQEGMAFIPQERDWRERRRSRMRTEPLPYRNAGISGQDF